MVHKSFLLAFDQGTTSSRAVLFDDHFNIVDISQQESRQYFPKPGWVEQDAVEIWESQLFVARSLINKLDILPENIAGIGITNQRETTIVWNRHTGKPVYNAIIWQDRRTADFCKSLKNDGIDGLIADKTGLVLDAYFSATKLRWILNEVPGARVAAENGDLLFGTVDSWLLWNLSGRSVHATDVSNASRTMLFNIHSLCWDIDLLKIFDIPACMLPELKDCSSFFFDTAKDLLCDGAIAICGVAGDQQAALFGQACFEPGMVKNTYGTGCFMLMNTGDKPAQSKSGLISTVAWKIGNKLSYAVEGSVFIAGAAVKWLRDGLHVIRDAAETSDIASQLSNSAGVYVVPAFAGLGAPYWNMNARGGIFGLTQGVTEKHLIRATLESLAYQTRDIIEAMQNDTGIRIKSLKVDGGACANNYLMQFQSDILNTPVSRPAMIESTALGAACLAGLASGTTDMQSLGNKLSNEMVFSPKFDNSTRELLYHFWKKAVSRCIDWCEDDV
ncbi:MAG TPA: glycerol kinase GlpK [Bacteroidales bacterium]|nr:glycerol kinase GlpK [Bacteroidales bacterium]